MDYEKKAVMIRRVIAKNMLNSWSSSPKCDYEMSINATPMIEFVKEYRESKNCKISYLNIVTKAASIALNEFPYVNSSFDSDRNMHILHEDINVGFAIAVQDGLMVANIRDADKCDLELINQETNRLIEAVRNGMVSLDDISGSTFTINNMGKYKRLKHHNAIINQPELAIMSMYNITDEPVVIDGELKIQKRMNLMLSADHRVIDGEMACNFLDRVCEILENPGEYLI